MAGKAGGCEVQGHSSQKTKAETTTTSNWGRSSAGRGSGTHEALGPIPSTTLNKRGDDACKPISMEEETGEDPWQYKSSTATWAI